MSVIDTKTDALVVDIAIGGKPRGMAASPDGSRVFVSDQATSTLHVLRTKQRREAAIAVGKSPEGVSASRDGPLGRHHERDAERGRAGRRGHARGRGAHPDPGQESGARGLQSRFALAVRRLYVANGRSGSVSVIDTATNTRVADIAAGKLPWGVAIH